MFKFVFCALFAVAAAKPELFLTSQLSPLTTYLGPTTITKSASGFIRQGPLVYSSPIPYAHYIKKRSAPLTYSIPTTYWNKPLLTTYSGPLVHSPAIWSSEALPTHFIKKRSASVLATSYNIPTVYTASAPSWSSSLSSPLISSSFFAPTTYVSDPYSYATHLIKKRSEPALEDSPAVTTDSNTDLLGAPHADIPWLHSPADTA